MLGLKIPGVYMTNTVHISTPVDILSLYSLFARQNHKTADTDCDWLKQLKRFTAVLAFCFG